MGLEVSDPFDDRPRSERSSIVVPRLWLLAFCFFGIGDSVTTVVGLSVPGVVEAGPVVQVLLGSFGVFAIVPIKLVTFSILYLLWQLVPRPFAIGVPLGLTVLGVGLTAWNVFVLVSVMVS